MKKFRVSQSALFNPRVAVGVLLCFIGGSLGWLSMAAPSTVGAIQKRAREVRQIEPNATPPSATLTPTSTPIPWAGAPAVLGVATDESACIEGSNCDTFVVTLSGTPGDWSGKKAKIMISWLNASDDFDVFVHKGATNTGPLVGSSASGGAGPEVVEIDPNSPGVGTGPFSVHVVYFLVAPTDSYGGNASVIGGGAPTPTPTPSPGATPTPVPVQPGAPRFHTFAAPPGTGEDAGEPSIGMNWNTENVPGRGAYTNSNGTILNGGTATYYGGFLAEMLRITFGDCSSPASALWEKKPLVLAATPRALGDPILHTNFLTGRTFVSQEESEAGSTTDVTDDDGDTFQASQGAGGFAGFDHQTIASGPYHPPLPLAPPPSYPATGTKQAVYFAAQNVADARISRSDDGGILFPTPSYQMYTTLQCGGLHGHIKVTPETPATIANGTVGVVYVPNNACGGTDLVGHADGQQAAIVSEDNGVNWTVRSIPTSDTKSDRDPSIGIATDGTVYMGMQSKDGHPRISVTHNKGVTWSTPLDVGLPSAAVTGAPAEGIKNIVFPAVVAGDGDQAGLNKGRAAFAFYGTTTGGDNYDQPEFPGVWYLFIATTYDSGQTWITQNVTPGDPIQRGGICGDGDCRNLLDFFDATIDKEGRVLVGWDDGCIGGCVNGGNNSFTSKATITRQAGGKRMFAAFDPAEPAIAGAPAVKGTLTGSTVRLNWEIPDNGGSEIVAYNIYKGSGASFPLLATVTVPNFTDPAYTAGQKYRVTAVNGIGEGPYCNEFTPPVGPVANACDLPGVLVINDLTATGADNDSAQNTPVDPRVNARQLFVAEPFIGGGVEKLFFTLQVAPSGAGSAPPNSQWFIIWDRQGTPGGTSDPNDAKSDRLYVAMRTDAAGTPSFEYGYFGHPINTGGTPPPPPDGAENTAFKKGDADSGSYDPLTGLIKITLKNSDLRTIDGGSTKYNAGSSLGGINVRTYFNRPDPGQRSQNNASDITDNSIYNLVGNASCAPAVDLARAVSRKMHGAAGEFDVRLVPADSKGGIECRSGGGTGTNAGSYQVVMTFAAPVTYTGASAPGTTSATASPAPGSPPTNEVVVTLTDVPNATTTNVNLTGVSTGGPADTMTVPLKVLIGDVNASRRTDATDVSAVRRATVSVPDDETFRNDVNASGRIDSTDTTLARLNSVTILP